MEQWANRSFDVIVVGSGPGGATVAKELSIRKKKVLILEWGSAAPIEGSMLQTIGMGLVPGKSLLFTNQMLELVRAITAGGSSVLAYATAFDPPLEMFQSYGVDISHEIEEAKRELPVGPLADELVGPMAHRIMESAQELGYDWQKLPKIVYQEKCRPDCDKCAMGCPYGAKWTARVYLEEARRNGAILVSRAKVHKVIIEGNAATGVVFSLGGKQNQFYAPEIVLAAGGIGSAVILRASGIGNAGYNYFFDPLILVMGTAKDIRGGKEFPMATGIHMQDEGYMMTDLVSPRRSYQLLAAQVLRFDRLFSHAATLPIMIKAKDSLGGYLTDRGGVRKRLDETDRKKLMRGYDRAKKILENAGARHIFKTWYLAAHPGGTAKINEVVDSDLRTEYDNLYVCDCSVIPEAWGLPPILTLIGLGKRLAKHLTGET